MALPAKEEEPTTASEEIENSSRRQHGAEKGTNLGETHRRRDRRDRHKRKCFSRKKPSASRKKNLTAPSQNLAEATRPSSRGSRAERPLPQKIKKTTLGGRLFSPLHPEAERGAFHSSKSRLSAQVPPDPALVKGKSDREKDAMLPSRKRGLGISRELRRWRSSEPTNPGGGQKGRAGAIKKNAAAHQEAHPGWEEDEKNLSHRTLPHLEESAFLESTKNGKGRAAIRPEELLPSTSRRLLADQEREQDAS